MTALIASQHVNMLGVQADICSKFFSIRNTKHDRALQMRECYKMVEDVEISSYVSYFFEFLQDNKGQYGLN